MEKQLEEHLNDWVDEMVKKFSREDIVSALEDKAQEMRDEDAKEPEGD